MDREPDSICFSCRFLYFIDNIAGNSTAGNYYGLLAVVNSIITDPKQQKMKYIAEINIMPLKDLLDPQGKAVTNSMKNLGFNEVSNVRIGKHITLEIEADSEAAAGKRVDEACNKILTNPIIEGYEYTLHPE